MKELFRGAPCQKPKLVPLTIKKQRGPRNKWAITDALKGRRWSYAYSFGPSELSEWWGGEVENVIATRLDATLSLKMRKTSLCHVDPLLCSDGLTVNTVRCLVPGCILTNERLLLGFGGQSTYGAVNSESKNKLLCKNPKCANTTGSKFNQLSLVAAIQLPYTQTTNWKPSPCLVPSPQASLKASTPRWWYSIYYDGHFHLSRSSVRHKLNCAAVIRDLGGCHRQGERGIHGEFQLVADSVSNHTYPPPAEWNGWHVWL